MSGGRQDAYELSAEYMRGLVQAVHDAGYLDGALAVLPPDLAAALRRPPPRPWWDADFAEQLAYAVGREFGLGAVEQVGLGVVELAMGPLIEGELRQLLSAPGAGPEVLFAHLEGFAARAVRPISTKWTPREQQAGTLELFYARAVRVEILALWRGAVRYAFAVTKREGRIEKDSQGPEAGRLVFEVSWS